MQYDWHITYQTENRPLQTPLFAAEQIQREHELAAVNKSQYK